MLGILVSLLLLGANENRIQSLFAVQETGAQRVRALCRYECLAHALAGSAQAHDATQGRRIEERFRELEQGAADLRALFRDSPALQQRLTDIHRQMRHWVDEISALPEKTAVPLSAREWQARCDALEATVAALNPVFRHIEEQVASPQRDALADAIGDLRQTTSGVAAISIMGVLVLWWWSLGVIRRGLRAMEGALTRVAQGKTSPTLDPGQLPQEFGNVVNAYHSVCQHLVDRSSVHARDMETLNEQLLKGLITICSSCKKIKTERGQWVPIEAYVRSRTTADFTHALCQECLNKTLDNL
jgi:hypothetical protein